MANTTGSSNVFCDDPNWQWHGKSYIALEYDLRAERELQEIREANERLAKLRGE